MARCFENYNNSSMSRKVGTYRIRKIILALQEGFRVMDLVNIF